MKRVSEINEVIKFNNTNIGGMKEIMIKAHALARLIRLPNEPYAHAFRNALKTVWQKIRRADCMQKHVYIYFINGAYAFAETRMNITVASDYFSMIDSVDKRCESAVIDVENDDSLLCKNMRQKEKLRLFLLETINAWLPQLIPLENYNKMVFNDDFTIDDELRAFINTGRYKVVCSNARDVLIQFIYEYGFLTKCRIKNYVSSYGLDD